MLIPTTIQVLTVITEEAHIHYQQVYINDQGAAKADFDRQSSLLKDLLLKGWSVSLKKF